jgi:hypothetical protein
MALPRQSKAALFVALFLTILGMSVSLYFGFQTEEPVRKSGSTGFEDSFPHLFVDPEHVSAMSKMGVASNSNVAMVYFAANATDIKIVADGVSHMESGAALTEAIVTELRGGGRLVAVEFTNTIEVTTGGATVTLDLSALGGPQRVGIDMSGFGAHLYYLKKGEGYA